MDLAISVGDSSSIELKRSKLVVKKFNHMIVEFSTGVGIGIDVADPAHRSDVD